MPAPSTASLGHWRRYLCQEIRARIKEHGENPATASAAVKERIRAEFLAAFPSQGATEAERIFDGRA